MTGVAGRGRFTWIAAPTRSPSTTRIAFDDKEAVTADRFRPGVAYVVWVQFRLEPGSGATGDLYFARTSDRGRSWTRPRRIYEASLDAAASGPEVVVTGRRRLVCVFSTVEQAFGVAVPGAHVTFWALRSRDGGRTWSAPSASASTTCDATVPATRR
jgi:hypothetical protein